MSIRTHAQRGIFCAFALLAAPSLFPMGDTAFAQTESATPSHVVVITKSTPLRSGAGLDWYPIAPLDQGTVLRTRKEVEGWLRVDYPSGTPAVVRTSDAEHREGENVVILTRRSALVAFNTEDPAAEQCYKRVFVDQQLPPGTVLSYLAPMENRRGEVAGYKIVAPAGATGYVLPADVRAATPQEIAAFEGPNKPKAKREATNTPTTPSIEMGKPDTETAEPDDAEAPEPNAHDDEPTPEPHAATPRPSTKPARAPAAPPAGSLEALDKAYERVMAQDIESAEFNQLISEYKNYRDALPDVPESEIDRQYVDARIELLRIRAELQSRFRKLAILEADAQTTEQSLDQLVKGIQAARGYAVVGKLAPSIVYDGQRLPRMYRITSLDANSGGRTLAYILPVEDLGLVGKLGAIVGIIGEDDPTAARGEVRVIRPTLAEVLDTE